jgi:Bacterial cadherin-like domain
MNVRMVAATTTGAPVTTVGANFEGANFTTDPGVFFTPPDTDGAVGPNAVVELLNNVYRVYDKAGALLQTSSSQDFWLNAGATFPGFAFDPRVVYDPASQRWFASAADNPFSPNTILLAVSNTSDPTQGWQAISTPSDPTGQTWADFDRLGVNQSGVFIAVNMFVINTENFSSEQVIAFPKSDLLQPVPTAANATVFANVNLGDTGFSPHPALAFQSLGPEPLISAYNTPLGLLKVTSIDGPITSPFLDTADRFVSVTPETDAFFATQKGTDVQLDLRPFSAFSSSAVFQDDKMFAIQGIEQNGLAALRWLEIGDVLTNPVVLDSGIINPPNLNVYDGSIAVNSLGQVLIGYTGSGPNDYPSAYGVAGTLVGDHLQLGDPMLLKAGEGPYLGTFFEAGSPVRWGDYSATTVDPVDPSHFWTFEEWAADNGSGGIQWSTQISEIIFPSKSPPVAHNDIAGVTKNHDVSGNVLTNDFDPKHELLTVTGVTGATTNGAGQFVAKGVFGTLVVDGDGTFTYEANKIDFPDHGLPQDTFTYTATNTDQLSSQATLAVTVVEPGQTYIGGTPGIDADHLTVVTGGNGKQVIDGSLGFEQISGGNGKDVLVGGAGDVLTGGRGNDTFVFKNDFGANTITDFGKGDTIQLDQGHFHNFTSVIANAAPDGHGGTLISDPSHSGNTIDLLGVKIADLHANDFFFV